MNGCSCSYYLVQTYWKNFGPRVGAIYSLNDRQCFALRLEFMFSREPGTGGYGVYATGTGQTGFNMTAIGNAGRLPVSRKSVLR